MSKVPTGAYGLYVMEDSGKKRYKQMSDVLITDEILCKDNGDPIYTMNKPGRPKKVELKPVDDEVAALVAAREGFFQDSRLVEKSKRNPESEDVYDSIMMAFADEVTALEFERKEAERHGFPTTDISVKRSRVLKAMADAWLKKQEKSKDGVIDLESEAWEKLLVFLLSTFKSALTESGVRPELIETVFARLGVLMDSGWNEVAKTKMKK